MDNGESATRTVSNSISSRQARYWIATIPYDAWNPCWPIPGVNYMAGQAECGGTTGYRHWQLVVYCSSKCSLSGIKRILPESGHYEPTRSPAARRYVFKEETRIGGSKFEYGSIAVNRSDSRDWDLIKRCALGGSFNDIPSDVYVRLLISNVAIIHLSREYIMTTWHQLVSLGTVRSSLDQQEVVRLGGRSSSTPLPILRFRALNFGAATEVRRTLLSMNFEELSISPTYSDGWIGTLSLWRQRDLPVR